MSLFRKFFLLVMIIFTLSCSFILDPIYEKNESTQESKLVRSFEAWNMVYQANILKVIQCNGSHSPVPSSFIGPTCVDFGGRSCKSKKEYLKKREVANCVSAIIAMPCRSVDKILDSDIDNFWFFAPNIICHLAMIDVEDP